MANESIGLEDVNRLARQYRNWGKWGPNDEAGAINFITPTITARAAGLVRSGRVISLSLPFDADGPQTGAYGRTNPLHFMLQDGGDIASGAQDHMLNRYTDDAIYMPLQCSTQWDALAHIFHDGEMYNGYGLEQVNSQGAQRNSITAVKDRIVSRGVLLDIPRYRGVDWVPPSEAIHGEELEACGEAQGIDVGEGDIVLVRTGQLAQVRAEKQWGAYAGGAAPGLAVDTCHFFCPRRVAAVATDTWGVEPQPNETKDIFQPLHVILLVNAGMLLGEMFDLEELSAHCSQVRIYEFLLVAAPLNVTGAVGSPINPLAIM
jgi:kynurenine formamidase